MTQHIVLETIKKRRSIRSYQERQVAPAELEAVLTAGQYAPSAINQQLWHFTVVQKQTVLDELSVAAKVQAAQHDNEHVQKLGKSERLHIFYHAPTAIIVSGQADAVQVGADCAAAMQNMLLAAEALGLGACWIGLMVFAFAGDQASYFRQVLQLPQGYQPLYALALGYKKTEPVAALPRKGSCVNYIVDKLP